MGHKQPPGIVSKPGPPGGGGGGVGSSGGMFVTAGFSGGAGNASQLIPEDNSADTKWIAVFHPRWTSAMTYLGRGDLGFPIAGAERRQRIYWIIESESGSGTNSWWCEPVALVDTDLHPDLWQIFPHPDGVPVPEGIPVTFDSADLPYTVSGSIPFQMACGPWGVRFRRTGTGTHQLRCRTWSDR